MKAWKRTLSAVMSICLVFSLFTGLNFTSTAAGEHGILQNGALSENTNGWAITGMEEVSADNGVEAGCKLDGDAKHLSIWNNSATEQTFSMTQTITNMAAGTYTAKVESVGNGATKHNLILKAHNDTSKKEVTVNVNTTDWQNYTASSTAELEVAEGDTVTISISGAGSKRGRRPRMVRHQEHRIRCGNRSGSCHQCQESPRAFQRLHPWRGCIHLSERDSERRKIQG